MEDMKNLHLQGPKLFTFPPSLLYLVAVKMVADIVVIMG